MREVEIVGRKPDTISYSVRRSVRARTVCLHEDAGVSFDQVVVSSREAIGELCHSGGFCGALLGAHAQSVSMSELEGREFGCRVLSVVNGELCQPQPICPTFLFFGTEQLQVLLHFSVHDFRLTIHLWVMHRGELG